MAREPAGLRGGAMKTWFTVAEGAAYAGVSRDTIYTACEHGELRHARIGGRRSIRLKPDWIDAWLEQHARGTNARANARGGGGGSWNRSRERLKRGQPTVQWASS